MRVFITGATGFAGSHLVDLLVAAGHQIFALVHGATGHQELPAHELVHAVPGDLMDVDSLQTAVFEAKPDIVYHLAGQAYPERSWQNPAATVAVNTGGTANLLQAVVAFGRPRVIVVTSAEIYGRVRPEDLPLTEMTVPQPRHPYGVSKWAASLLVPIYRQRYRLPVIEARPFNHIGPRQALGFVAPDFASQLAAIKLGQKAATISVGNLDARRDFTDVRDVVRAYVDLAETGEPGEAYLICSGQPVPILALLTILIELSQVDVEIIPDPTRMRPSDTPSLYGSYAKLQQHTGWQPKVPLRESLIAVFQEWLDRLSQHV